MFFFMFNSSFLFIQAFDTMEAGYKKATAEDLIRYAKPITTATAKAVAAGNSGRQEDIISTANVGRKAIFDLLSVVRVRYYHPLYTSKQKSKSFCIGRYYTYFYNLIQ